MVVAPSLEEENSLITPMMMMTMKMTMRITTWWPRARMMRMTSAMTTPAERKCIRGSGMSASSEKSQELCHILLPEREIHTEIFTEILLLINKDEKNFDAPPSSSIICQPSIHHLPVFSELQIWDLTMHEHCNTCWKGNKCLVYTIPSFLNIYGLANKWRKERAPCF